MTRRVLITDIEAANGTVHVIDSVLIPPEPEAELGTIVDIAVARRPIRDAGGGTAGGRTGGDAAGRRARSRCSRPRTTRSRRCRQGTVEALLGDIPALTEILLYHVVAGNAVAADVVMLDSVTTVQGDAVNITVDGRRRYG